MENYNARTTPNLQITCHRQRQQHQRNRRHLARTSSSKVLVQKSSLDAAIAAGPDTDRRAKGADSNLPRADLSILQHI
jgi:hypothetical protein